MRIILSMLLLCWSLLGCHHKQLNPIDDIPTLPIGVDGSSDAAKAAMYKKLTEEGVQIVTMGQEYMVSIPATLLFPEQSPKIKWQSYNLLNEVVCYLQYFRKITVHVNAFGSCYRSGQRTHALTLARSRVIGNYLWSHNIESRIVFTEGLGDDKPIVAVTNCSDASMNARVEIVFRQVMT